MGLPIATVLAPEQALPTITNTTVAAPKFGEPGFRKGAVNPRKGTPRARITSIDLTYLLFLANFTGASAEALSMIREGDETNLGTSSGGLPTIKATENRMRKLKKLGAVFSERHAGTGVTSYSLTADGFGYLRSAGFEIDHGDMLRDTSLERLNHYEKIAQVAAMFASPAGLFEDSLGIAPVPVWNLMPEKAMRQASAPVKAEMKALRVSGQPGDFGPRRELELKKLVQAANQGTPWSNVVRAFPVVLTLALAETAGKKFRGVYEPDLAVLLDDQRTGSRARNLLVEVELSRKSETAYHAIFETLAAEFKLPLVYSTAVYMVASEAVANRLIKVNREGNHGLIESGRLKIIYITHRDGTPVQVSKRISYGDN
jgi:hypothetical protein